MSKSKNIYDMESRKLNQNLRSLAKKVGLKRYFTGIPCRKGHIAERQVSNRACLKCLAENVIKWQKNSPEITKIWMDKSRKKYNEINIERVRKSKRDYKKRNPVKTRIEKCADQAAREAKKLKATPNWANKKEIKKFYEEADKLSIETGIKYSVDHILPLRGKLVSGLHCEFNLQVMTLRENVLKGVQHGLG